MNYQTLNLGSRTIEFRPWIVKDKYNITQAKTPYDKRKALVYNCLKDPNTPLDINEYQYTLFAIRNASLDYLTDYEVTCEHCVKDYRLSIDFKDVIKPRYADYTPIETKHIITLGDIKNQSYYEEAMQAETNSDKRYLIDFVLHIDSIDDIPPLGAPAVIDFLESLDIIEFEHIMTLWDSKRFSFDLLGAGLCPYCGHKTLYRFNSVQNFFPNSWY